MSDKLDVKGKTINQIVRWYFYDELYVNRKYQRKLVWSIEEKKLYIDSLLRSYPTPSIMINTIKEEYADGTLHDKNEIVDGLQRLDAIISFIINDFSIEIDGIEGYFDISVIPTAQQKVNDGSLIQKEPRLPLDMCYDFTDCEIPVVLTGQDDEKIKEIFCRINSSGKKLSSHDLRQASALDDFAELVRRCAIRIRGDYTYYDSVNMCDMRKISISGKELNYGVNSRDVFWRRHGIITYENLRRSRDEEIVASLLTNILLNKTKRVNSEALDKMYNETSESNRSAVEKIKVIGRDILEEKFNNIVVTIDNIFYSVNSTLSEYLFKEVNSLTGKISGKDEIFQVLFLALYNLTEESYSITNYKDLANKLKSNANYLFSTIITAKSFSSDDWQKVYKGLYAFLKTNMQSQIVRETTSEELEIKHRLSISDFEFAMTEFKLGIVKLGTADVDRGFIERIGKTLVAMANSPVEREGYLILGIANDEDSAKRWEHVYRIPSLKYGNHYVVGIEAEAHRSYGGIPFYMTAVKDLIKNQPISGDLKQYVLSNMQIVNFEDKKLFLIKSKKQQDDSDYAGVRYIRNGESTEKI